MKRWVYLTVGLALAINAVIAIVGIASRHLSMLPGIIQVAWGVLGIYLTIKAIILFKKNRIKESML